MKVFKDKIASILGSILEWYDFALYGFFSQLIAQLYFPSESTYSGLLKTFSIFAIGFLARPFGALLFGYIGDKYGRTVCLRITPILITIPTLIFSLLPTYQQIGIFAPLIVLLIRICQGVCIGGEYANNIIYLCESSKKSQTYFSGSLGSCSGSIGICLASFVATICYKTLSPENLLCWGWRIAFSISLILGLATFLMRRNMVETPVFKKISKENRLLDNPITTSYVFEWRNYLIALGVTFLPATAFYYVFMFLPSFLNQILKINATNVLGDNSSSLFLRILIIPIVGIIADKTCGLKISRIASILFFILSYPLLVGITTESHYSSTYILCFALLTTLNAGTTPGLLFNILRPNSRCTILSFSFNFSFGVFGGIVPIISLILAKYFNSNVVSVYYLMVAAFITFVTTFFINSES